MPQNGISGDVDELYNNPSDVTTKLIFDAASGEGFSNSGNLELGTIFLIWKEIYRTITLRIYWV